MYILTVCYFYQMIVGPVKNGRFSFEDYLDYKLQGEVMDSAQIVTTTASCSIVKNNSQWPQKFCRCKGSTSKPPGVSKNDAAKKHDCWSL